MDPTLKNGQTIIVSHSRSYGVGDVVVAYMDKREVIKRVTRIKEGKVYLEGDNKLASTDSRVHGWLIDRHIVGRVVWPYKP